MTSIEKQGRGTWALTGTGTTAGVSITHTPDIEATPVATSLEASSDAAAVLTVESPTGTPIFQLRFAAAFAVEIPFTAGLPGATGKTMTAKVSASTAHSEVNLQGFDD